MGTYSQLPVTGGFVGNQNYGPGALRKGKFQEGTVLYYGTEVQSPDTNESHYYVNNVSHYIEKEDSNSYDPPRQASQQHGGQPTAEETDKTGRNGARLLENPMYATGVLRQDDGGPSASSFREEETKEQSPGTYESHYYVDNVDHYTEEENINDPRQARQQRGHGGQPTAEDTDKMGRNGARLLENPMYAAGVLRQDEGERVKNTPRSKQSGQPTAEDIDKTDRSGAGLLKNPMYVSGVLRQDFGGNNDAADSCVFPRCFNVTSHRSFMVLLVTIAIVVATAIGAGVGHGLVTLRATMQETHPLSLNSSLERSGTSSRPVSPFPATPTGSTLGNKNGKPSTMMIVTENPWDPTNATSFLSWKTADGVKVSKVFSTDLDLETGTAKAVTPAATANPMMIVTTEDATALLSRKTDDGVTVPTVSSTDVDLETRVFPQIGKTKAVTPVTTAKLKTIVTEDPTNARAILSRKTADGVTMPEMSSTDIDLETATETTQDVRPTTTVTTNVLTQTVERTGFDQLQKTTKQQSLTSHEGWLTRDLLRVVGSNGAPWVNDEVTYDAAKALDGDTGTYWNPQITLHSYWSWNITFDLAVPQALTRVAVNNYGDTTHDIAAFTLQQSQAGSPYKWEDVVTVTNVQGGTDRRQEFGGFQGTARYWRFLITRTHSGYQPWLRELNFHGISAGVNLALGKSAFQTTTFHEVSGFASHAVDGNTNTWISIFNRQDCCSERINPFNIHIGDSDQASTNPMCGGDNQIDVNQPSISVSCQGMKGRYVSVRLPGSSRILTLCEVQVRAFLGVGYKQECKAGYIRLKRHCFRLVSHTKSFLEALEACKAEEAILAMPKTEFVDLALRRLVQKSGSNSDYWIGMIEAGSDWKWLDGARLGSYQGWHPGEPSDLKGFGPLCVQYWSSGHTTDPMWDDIWCHETRRVTNNAY
uniref:C-type lectin domain-containing protein n=1 Tax=Branchiostoma floridae TaxID=7739 RepID=C3YS44_BRAFL|eukprot:XP_002600937.1 hypothetical protein BRAFLDRAFT_79127 [Branchiostoma floridae]